MGEIAPLLLQTLSRGRPFADNRQVLEGILWVLRSGARWRDLPPQCPSASTCWRRLRDWEEQGVWLDLWRAFLRRLDRQQKLDWNQCFVAGSFAPAKKGATASAKPSEARVQSVDGQGIPLGSRVLEASPAEVTLVEHTLNAVAPRQRRKITRLIADRAYDSDR